MAPIRARGPGVTRTRMSICERVGMRRRCIVKLGLILSVVFQGLPEPVERLFHVAFAEWFSDVEPQRGKRQRLSRRLAQSFDLHAIDVEILTDDEIQAHSSGNVGQFGAQIRIAARAKQFSQACAFRFHGKWLAGLNRQLGRILFQHRAGFGDHAHCDDARRLTGKTVLRGERACAEEPERRQPCGEPYEGTMNDRHHSSQQS